MEKQVLFVCDGDASKIGEIKKLTIWRFLFVLNEKLKKLEKLSERATNFGSEIKSNFGKPK